MIKAAHNHGVAHALARYKLAGPLERLLATEKALGSAGARDFYKWQQGRGALETPMRGVSSMHGGVPATPKVVIDPAYAHEAALRGGRVM